MTDDNYYEQLGVEPDASRDEIRDAHRARVADLEAAREKKGISDSQLQQNRDEVARVRAAWNVLSDPFQRKRYDAQISAPNGDDTEIDLVDAEADDAAQPGNEVQLTGWRKFMSPPPPKPTATKSGANGTAKAPPTNKRPRPEPTIVIPGTQLAEPRQRGMAMLFDIAILLVIYTAVSFLLPNLIQSDYPDIVKQIDKISAVGTAQGDVNDAQKSLNQANTQKETSSAQKDLNSAQKDLTKATKEAKQEGVTPAKGATGAATSKALDKQEQKLRDSIVGTQYAISITILVLGLLYLVPITARTGRTLGMRNRHLKIVRVDGSPVTWWAAFIRFFVPLTVAFVLLIPLSTLAPMIGLAIVAWSFFDKNRQGLHDKLARTVVVSA
jgi:uncharacterized RDD family membrane protein YckC